MQLHYRIISIGTLAANPLWNEKGLVRTGHATTTLIQSADTNVLVDPSLPPQAMLARFQERTSLNPNKITHVFLTSFDRERRRALELFDSIPWLMHEPEIESAREAFKTQIDNASEGGDEELVDLLETEMTLLNRIETAPDSLAPGVDLFPLPGVTPGTCGLLLIQPNQTVLIASDAVATEEHLAQGKVLPTCTSLEAAQESFQEAIEIADVIVPGRDNVILNPVRRYS